MAAQKPPRTTIEFIPQEDWEKTPFGKFLKWVLTVGRWIVIITQLIVILAFLARFKLDRDLTDLNEKVKQQQAIINTSSEFEKEFRFLQKRLSTAEELRKTQLETDQVLNELASLTPVNVYLSDLNVTGKDVTLTATAFNEEGLTTFLDNLKNSTQFTKLTIPKVRSDPERGVGLNFELKSELKL
jgi:Tfp pilus assembly protein PilN